MKIGAILRGDPCGLSTLSVEFYRHLSLKALVPLNIQRKFDFLRFFFRKSAPLQVNKSLFPDAMFVEKITDKVARDFLKGLDVLLAFETPYNWNVFKIAREMGVKTVLFVNFEWIPEILPTNPDLFLCPSMADFEVMADPKIFLPPPVNREALLFRERKIARVFLHNAGSGGKGGRNSTHEVLQAIPLVKSDAKFIINIKDLDNFSDLPAKKILSKIPREFLKEGKEFEMAGKSVCVKEGTYADYAARYKDGDVLIHPQIYSGLSLPMQEAISCGMPIIAIDRFPDNGFLNKELLVKPYKQEMRNLYRKVKAELITPEALAAKIDQVYSMPIEKYSRENNALAEKWDWKNMTKIYLEMFENLKNGKTPLQGEEERDALLSPF
jgi:glycosyltransferase involved in cell wall biosynthesis